jgi:molybdopterin converting factor small subunit
MVRLVFLGKFRDLAPATLDTVELPTIVRTLNDLRAWIGAQTPALGATLAATPFKLIVNHEIVHDLSREFQPDDEIAFMPPMSGG